MAFGKNQMVAGFTLLIIASYGEFFPGVTASSYAGGRALCDKSTGIMCRSDARCVAFCKTRAKSRLHRCPQFQL
ncbi:unnamed protein product [Urochloa humidicola]